MSLKIVLSFLCLCTTIHCKKSSVLRSLTSSSSSSSLLSPLKNARRKLLSAGDQFWDNVYDELDMKLKGIQPQMNNLITELKQITNKRLDADEQGFMFNIMFSSKSSPDIILQQQSQPEKYMDFVLECLKAVSDFFQTNKASIMQILKDSAKISTHPKKDDSDLFKTLCMNIVIFDSFNALSDIMYKHKQDILKISAKASEISDSEDMQLQEVALFFSSLKETFSNDELSKIIDTVSESLANILPIIGEHNQGMAEEENDALDKLANQVVHFKKDNVVILIRNAMEIMVTIDLNIISDKEKLMKWLLQDKFGEIYVVFKNELGEEETKMIIHDMVGQKVQLTPEECDTLIKHYTNKNDGLSKTTLIIIIVGSVTGVILIGIVLYFCCKKK